jgi:N-acetylglutamate synthase-like GNAT family acetyltransferase
MEHALVRVASEANWQVYHAIRRRVLWHERGRSGYDESRPEERMSDNHPLLLTCNGQGIGTTRLDDLRDGTGIVRLVAITGSVRGRGHGRILSMMVEDYARRLGIDTLFVNAALDAEGFYVATGWTRCLTYAPGQLGQAEATVPMVKSIARRGS